MFLLLLLANRLPGTDVGGEPYVRTTQVRHQCAVGVVDLLADVGVVVHPAGQLGVDPEVVVGLLHELDADGPEPRDEALVDRRCDTSLVPSGELAFVVHLDGDAVELVARLDLDAEVPARVQIPQSGAQARPDARLLVQLVRHDELQLEPMLQLGVVREVDADVATCEAAAADRRCPRAEHLQLVTQPLPLIGRQLGAVSYGDVDLAGIQNLPFARFCRG